MRFLPVAVAIVTVSILTTAFAEPPERPAGAPDRPGAGERRGPPSPERMVEHAMRFDADGDGKLDRAEFTKFAEEFHAMRTRAGGGGPGGPGGKGGRPNGEGGRKPGRGPGRGDPPGGGDGSAAPSQPE